MSLSIKNIDRKSVWDDFLKSYAPNVLFQKWEWGEAIKKIQNPKSKGQMQIERVGLYDDNKLVGIAQTEKVIARRGTFYHLRHGPVVSSWKMEYIKHMVGYFKGKARKEGVDFLRVSPQIENSSDKRELFSTLKFIPSPMHAMDGEYVWVLDLSRNEEEILSQMRKTTRYLIRKAAKIGVSVISSNDISDFLNLYQITSKRQGFVPHKGIKEEFEIFSKDNKAWLLIAKYKRKILAGALILLAGNQAIYHHGAAITNDIPASYLLQWEAIKKSKNFGLNYYNFWGISPSHKPNHPWQGLTLFKQGFGGETREFIHAQDYPFSKRYYLTYLIEWLRKIKKGY